MSGFPVTRLRRLRRTDTLRALVRETRLSLDDVVMPLFACPGEGVVRPVTGLEGIAQRSVDEIVREAAELAALGVRAVILFGIPEEKDEEGSGAWEADGIVQRALRALRAEVPGPDARHRRVPLRVHEPRPLRRPARRRGRERRDARAARPHGRQPRRGRRRRRRAERHDGRPGRRDPRGAARRRRSSPTPPSTPPRSTAPSARSPSRRRRSATVAATRWIRRTSARRCASARSTSRRAPTR